MTTNEYVIGLDDRAGWERRLARVPHAVAHTWDSCRAMAMSTGFATYLWCHEDGDALACCPIAERRCGSDVDVVTPLGFSGFTAGGSVPDLAGAWRRWCIARGYVCAYVALNPLFAEPDWFDPAEVASAQTLYVLDLRHGHDVLRANLQRSLQRKLHSAAAIENSEDVGRTDMARFFVERFSDCFAGRGAGGAYDLNPSSIEALAHLPQSFLLGVRGETGLESVTLFGRTADCGDAMFNVCTEQGRSHAFAQIWHGALHLQAGGVPFLNLGGGIREDDGVAQFKRRFGGEQRPLRVLRQIFDPERYRALCALANVDPGQAKYFPAYRAPGPAVRA